MVTPASSPRKVVGLAGRGFQSPEADSAEGGSINNKENALASFSEATTASCSEASATRRETNGDGSSTEMTPAPPGAAAGNSTSASFLTASFTPYSSFTPLSVKISRFAAQMAGAAGSGSGIPEVETTSSAKRQLNMEVQ